ncbi:MAG: hypothetical protein JXA10_00690 [Anaerolineae bacterium]|nr:hypothetical protein [Anaerolineae bacterium]
MNRLFGILLLVLGVLVGVIVAAWLFTNEDLEGSARILGLGIALIVLVAPMIGGGVYLLAFGSKESKQQQDAAKQRQLLNIVQTRGQVKIDELVIEMQLPREQVREMIYSLVGLGVFSGYIKWDEGVLYSSEASQLRDLEKCPNCGGEIELSGKGVAQCKFCGTEFFLS